MTRPTTLAEAWDLRVADEAITTRTAYEAGKRSAQQMAEALERTVKSAEQAAWEAWAASVNPSGDVESVQRQWERSIDFAEFCGAWSLQLDALRAYREQAK